MNSSIVRTFVLVIFLLSAFVADIYAYDRQNLTLDHTVTKKGLFYFLYRDTVTGETFAEVTVDYVADKNDQVPAVLKVEPVIKYQKRKYPVEVVESFSRDYSSTVVTTVILPPSIKEIGQFAFQNMKKLSVVKYDDAKGKLEKIGMCAFKGCTSLVVAPYANTECKGTTLKTIDGQAFEGCTRLYAFSFPKTIDSIENDAFKECTSLRVVNFPKEAPLRTIGNAAFQGCTSLNQIHLPKGLTKLGNQCFRESGVTEVWFPRSMKELGNFAFSECKRLIRTHYEGYDMERINDYAFNKCCNLETVDDCNHKTFENCFLEPKYIDQGAFSGCAKLVSTQLFAHCDTIENYAFSGCSSLKDITLNCSYLGKQAFEYCTSLKKVHCYSKYIDESAFHGCTALEEVYLGDKVTYIGFWAFECTASGKPTSLKNVYGLRPDIEYGSSLSCIFSYVKTDYSYNDYGCYYREIERSYQYNVLTKVKPAIKEWEKKKDYEKTSQWAKRVTEENRDKELQRLIDEAREEYIKRYAPSKPTYNLGNYDADEEVYAFTMQQCKSKVYVKVPAADRESFKENFKDATFTPEYCIKEDKLDLARCKVTVKGKTYTSPTIYEDDSTAVVSINLSPLEINLPTDKQKTTVANVPAKKSDVDQNIPTTSKKSEKIFVVIIGNENYSDAAISSASFAQNDANIFEQYCLKTLGIPQKNIHKKLDVTRNQLRSEVKWLTGIEDAFGEEAEIIFYYSGHGMPDEKTQKTYLLPSDGLANDPESGYAITTLYAQLGELNVKRVTIFLDACFSGSQRNGGMLTASKGVAVKVKADAPTGKMVVFSAATGDETAYPNTEENHGMFTYYLLKKLQESKGEVTLQSLGEYITTNVRQQSIVLNGKSQTPTVSPATSLGTEWQGWKLK